MGVIINIDEALKQRSKYNVLREPLNQMLKDSQEAWEKENPLDMIYTRNTIDTFQKTFVSTVGFDKAFAETGDFAVGPIFNTAEGFSATYRTKTFQGSFIITQQTLEDEEYNRVKDDASAFMRRWHGDIVEYGIAALSGGFGTEIKWGGVNGDGVSRIKLNSADTVDGTLDGVKNPLFTNKHTLVKRDNSPANYITSNYQTNKFYADIDINGSDSAAIAKLADFINIVITYMENLRDDNGKRAGVTGAKTIVCANDAHLKASIETALSSPMFDRGEVNFINPAFKRATLLSSPYFNDIAQCVNGRGFFIVDKSYNEQNHGLEITERIPLTFEVIDNKRPKGIIYDGRQRFDINVATWRGISYCYLGTPAGSSNAWDDVSTFMKVTPIETIVKPVTVQGTVNTKAST